MENIETWKDIEGFENLYQISSNGKIKSLNYRHTGKERIIKPYYRKNYHIIRLYKEGKMKRFLVHRLVAMAFIPNPNNYPCVNHKDENPSNNYIENLEWCTYQYNLNYGTRNERASKTKKDKKQTKEQIEKRAKAHQKSIVQLDKNNNFIIEWQSATQASNELNIDSSSITKCCKNKLKTCGGYIWRYANDNVLEIKKVV